MMNIDLQLSRIANAHLTLDSATSSWSKQYWANVLSSLKRKYNLSKY